MKICRGARIVAIDECVQSDGESALIVGKIYTIHEVGIYDKMLYVSIFSESSRPQPHKFLIYNLLEFFIPIFED